MKEHILVRLNDLKAKSGKSYEAVHEALGYATSTVHRWHKGESDPDLEQLTNLVEFYGGSMEKLFAAVGRLEMTAAQESGYQGIAVISESYEARLQAREEQIEYLNEEIKWLRGVIDAMARRGDHRELS
jgi:transcriptional regulator with XRE-family HTH domain